MAKKLRKQEKTSKTGKYQPLTVGDFESKYNVKLKANPRMRLTTYARSINQPNMGKLLEKVEKNLSKAH